MIGFVSSFGLMTSPQFRFLFATIVLLKFNVCLVAQIHLTHCPK